MATGWQAQLLAKSQALNKMYAPQIKAATAPKPAAPKPAAPTSPAAPGAGPVTDAPIPGVSAYGADMARAQAAYDQAVASTKGNLALNLQQLGFNPDGTVQGQNIYGAFQQNRRAGAQAAEAATESGAGRGLGVFGGLADQARNRATFQAGAGMSDILGQAQRANLGATAEIQSAGNTLQDRLAQAQLVAAQQSIADRNFTQAAPPAAGAPAAAPKSPGLFSWGGQQITNKAQLTAILAKSGVSYATWAKNHPAAAAKL